MTGGVLPATRAVAVTATLGRRRRQRGGGQHV